MERDTNQLLQEVERVVKGNVEGQYQTMFDAVMRKIKELRDAMRSAGGSQYADMQNMYALVAEAKSKLMAKMSAQAQRNEANVVAEREREMRKRVKQAAERALERPITESESESRRQAAKAAEAAVVAVPADAADANNRIRMVFRQWPQ